VNYNCHAHVSTAFLNAELKEEVYTEQPEGFKENNLVWLLVKSLYGIHQAPREWYLLVSEFVKQSLGFKSCVTDPCFFFKTSKSGKLILLIMFVDDFQIGYHHSDESEWMKLKELFCDRFKTKYTEVSQWMLGMKVTRDRMKKLIFINHEVYVQTVLNRFNMSDCKSVTSPERVGPELNLEFQNDSEQLAQFPYMQLVGSLMYAAISTRIDIAHAVHQLSKHSAAPQDIHWSAGKQVLRYIASTSKVGLKFGGTDMNKTMVVVGYSDADFANDHKTRKSVSGWIVKINGDVISWSSKSQSTVALSTCEAELIAACECVREVLWVQHLLIELGLQVENQSVVHVDNVAAITRAENGIASDRTKHIDIKYHFIMQEIINESIKLKWVESKQQQADILTKALNNDTFSKFKDCLVTDVV
jgi:hypothetical protein